MRKSNIDNADGRKKPLYRAIALDLDGVVTDTRRIHFQAWKETFDAYLEDKEAQEPFSETQAIRLCRREGFEEALQNRELKLNRAA